MLTDLLVEALRPLPWQGKLRLVNTFLPHAGERVCQAYGCRFRVDLGEAGHRRLYVGAYESDALRAIGGELPRGGCFVDAQADIGLFTALAAQRVGPSGQILAAESRPMSYLRLEGMVRENHLNNVILHHGTLGTTLDLLAERHLIHHVDLLKVGSADLTLLAGAARLLAHRRLDAIVCEVDPGGDTRILQQVGVLGFRHAWRLGSYHLFRSS